SPQVDQVATAPAACTNERQVDSPTMFVGPVSINRAQPPASSRINIAPYRKDLLARVARQWHPGQVIASTTVLIRVAKDGSLMHAEIVESSSDQGFDQKALEAVQCIRSSAGGIQGQCAHIQDRNELGVFGLGEIGRNLFCERNSLR